MASLHKTLSMGRHKLFLYDGIIVRNRLNEAIDLASEIHEKEQTLIRKLQHIDQRKFYLRYGYKSLSGFCIKDLKFSKTQTQRIVAQVRRYIPTDNIREKDAPTPGRRVTIRKQVD